MGPTETLAKFIALLKFTDLPEEVVVKTKDTSWTLSVVAWLATRTYRSRWSAGGNGIWQGNKDILS